jgi:hypothetical protein
MYLEYRHHPLTTIETKEQPPPTGGQARNIVAFMGRNQPSFTPQLTARAWYDGYISIGAFFGYIYIRLAAF